MPDGWDDEQLLEALRGALAARQAVPGRFIETGKLAYAWHNIDAELAQLTYDSSRDEPAMVRSELASVRALTFTSARFSIELEVTAATLLGQIMPSQPGTIEALARDGGSVTGPIDEAGGFCLRPLPASPFRLRCRAADGTDVITGWINL